MNRGTCETCECCDQPATWLVVQTTVRGKVHDGHPYCNQCAVDGAPWFLLHNDSGFAGPDQVNRKIVYRWIGDKKGNQ